MLEYLVNTVCFVKTCNKIPFNLSTFIYAQYKYILFTTYKSRGSSLSTMTTLRTGKQGFLVPVGKGIFSLRHRFQTGSGVHPASYPVNTVESVPDCKAD
jgi:hypothetical protein